MLITDHISCFAPNPLIGPNADEFGVRFPDMTSVYDEDLQAIIRNKAKEQRIDLKRAFMSSLPGLPLNLRQKSVCCGRLVRMR